MHFMKNYLILLKWVLLNMFLSPEVLAPQGCQTHSVLVRKKTGFPFEAWTFLEISHLQAKGHTSYKVSRISKGLSSEGWVGGPW